jgi:hypothetical protein
LISIDLAGDQRLGASRGIADVAQLDRSKLPRLGFQ